MTRALAITSGKGGVGKTNISLNIALQLSNLGHKVCLFDADLGLANINILLGIRPTHDILDLVHNKKSLTDVLVSTHGIDILPGSSGVEELANMDPAVLTDLLKSLSHLASYDYLLFDTSAGITKNVIAFCLSCPETLVVITPEPTSLTDAYALLKVLAANNYTGNIKVVINQCTDIKTAKAVYKRFKDAVTQYMSISIEVLGVVYKDTKLTEAVSRQVPFLKLFPDTIASKCIKKITERLLENKPEKFDQEIVSFWERCLNFMANPLELTGPKTQPPAIQVKEKATTSQPATTTKTLPEATAKVEPDSAGSTPDQSLTLLAKSIAEGIESISNELKEIRKELQSSHSRNGHNVIQNTDNSQNGNSELKPIILDLDRYLREAGATPEKQN
nr:P-loop NTPase [Desulfobulbaceae bacterium]